MYKPEGDGGYTSPLKFSKESIKRKENRLWLEKAIVHVSIGENYCPIQ